MRKKKNKNKEKVQQCHLVLSVTVPDNLCPPPCPTPSISMCVMGWKQKDLGGQSPGSTHGPRVGIFLLLAFLPRVKYLSRGQLQ